MCIRDRIINAGLTVVTAADDKQYSRETLKANPMDLVYSLLVIIRANEESETKSKRVSDALRRKCANWVSGTYRGRISCGTDPSWVRWGGKNFELIPEVSEVVKIVLRMFSEGHGAVHILQHLADTGLRVTGDAQAGNINQLCYKQPHLFTGKRIVKETLILSLIHISEPTRPY